jgi:hypothetical protein
VRALCLGGGHTLLTDLAKVEELGIRYDAVFACNDAGAVWAGELDGWVSLHPEKLDRWRKQRAANGHPPAKAFWAHRAHKDVPEIRVTEYTFPGQKASGSSGLYVAKVAMVNCGYQEVLFCGVPMTPSPHFFDKTNWRSCKGFRRVWPSVDTEYRAGMRSMSGWTRVLLGGPSDFIDGGDDAEDHEPE